MKPECARGGRAITRETVEAKKAPDGLELRSAALRFWVERFRNNLEPNATNLWQKCLLQVSAMAKTHILRLAILSTRQQ
jgi:hypothetical protein